MAIEVIPDEECGRFRNRQFDLCTGKGHDGRPDPADHVVVHFRKKNSRKQIVVHPSSMRFSPEMLDSVATKVPPGTHFKQLLSEINLKLPGCEGCQGTMARMNRAGVAGCKKSRDVFLTEIKSRAKSVTFQKKLTAAWTAVKTGLCWSINPLDPIASLYDLAVSRAEKQDASAPG